MYDNIGLKIKGLAKIGFYIAATVFVCWGILNAEATGGMSLLFMLAGIVLSLIFSWLLYGFGTLIVLLQNINFCLTLQDIGGNKKSDYARQPSTDNNPDKKE